MAQHPIQVSKAVHTKVKVVSALTGQSNKNIVEKAVDEYIRNHPELSSLAEVLSGLAKR